MSGDVRYRRTEFAWPTIVPLVTVAAVIATTFLRSQFVLGLSLFAGVWAIMLLLFSTLTVTVTGDSLVAAFGIGLVRKRVKFASIASFSQVRNPWYYGWGIHYFPGGTLYNASGLSAIEFRMSSGRYVRIGTPDPDGLALALQQVIGRPEANHETSPRKNWGAQHVAGAVIGAMALVFAGWALYAGMQPPIVDVSADSFAVGNGLYRTVIPFDRMRDMTLEADIPRIGLKTNGFSAGNTLRGTFRLDDWGSTQLYVNRDSPPFLVIQTVQDHHVVVNFKDPERTRALYTELTAAVNRSRR